ncbi:3-hydroxyacyl-CoA dehydrogenase family protein [Kurthia sibirica]|uniref:3-hydroxyacyl-CoA dehydrogenase n=1 Tax=Kurthia sibirica TaxID=202750 RepID=A0A2U3AP35_9BACL|nr:3-hydroxyacyl-CoA dehydrogenase family protein [Kurthia sibirica]PWI26313.1 3-hydroxyacyl-CoA dehydrogenase [Kurthia sibirica]GEK35018.1 hypothetical protein KSI01_25510 [Kurthia sibirica]
MEKEVKNIAVIGAGSMGHQIAMLSVLGGFTTNLYDVEAAALDHAEKALQKRMTQWQEKGKITDEKKCEAFAKLHMTTDLQQAVKEADLVIEAVVEKLDVKREVFKQLDVLSPSHAILATNSSSIVSSKVADITNRAEQICNMHFFFPPLVMDCVEVMRNEQTSDATVEAALAYCKKINRTAVLLHKEINGFIANRLLHALTNEALYLYENGYADFKEIDLIAKKALAHPMGPFELADLSGIDVGYFANLQLFKETGNIIDQPSKIVEEKVKAGHLGRKTGKGWYDYS